jgi:hypothetical protein
MKEQYSIFPMAVELFGLALIFTIVAAIVFQMLYLYLLGRSGLLHELRWRSMGLIIGASILSLSAAECIATYLFPNHYTSGYGVSNVANAPPIVVHAIFLAFLFRKAMHRSERLTLETG